MLLEYWYNELWAQDWYHYERGLRETAPNMLMSISYGEGRNEVKLKQGASFSIRKTAFHTTKPGHVRWHHEVRW